MINPKDPITCKACALNRALIAKLDERLTALETDVRGAPVEVLLEEFDTAKAQRDARQSAIALRSLHAGTWVRALTWLHFLPCRSAEPYAESAAYERAKPKFVGDSAYFQLASH